MNKVRVRSADQTSTLSLALSDEKDENGCYEIKFEDVGRAESFGFHMWRPHHQAAADAARAQAAQVTSSPAFDHDSSQDAPPAPDAPQDKDGGNGRPPRFNKK